MSDLPVCLIQKGTNKGANWLTGKVQKKLSSVQEAIKRPLIKSAIFGFQSTAFFPNHQ